MAPTIKANTVGSSTFDADEFLERWAQYDFQQSPAATDNDLRTTLATAFALPQNEAYVYHAIASVTLAQVQLAINAGGANGLHAWYRDAEGRPLDPPPRGDIAVYTSIFSSTTSTPKALMAMMSNAKKQSLRAGIAAYLSSHRQLPATFNILKLKTPHVNPYLDVWAWSCQNLEWAGPDDVHTPRAKHSHPVLPILMHHFGCLCPSYEGLEVIKQLVSQRRGGTGSATSGVLEIGSGNGYWAYLLRRLGVAVTAIDNRQSVYRTLWISDTLIIDGIAYLKSKENQGAKDLVLLLVYPIVGGNGFTAKILDAYQGDTVVVAGTQNHNGYTGFSDMTVAEYMAKEKPAFDKTVQIPLPSFAGKDEALFVFERQR